MDLKNFCERMGRRFGDIAILWRLEPQKRGAPHYHLLVWGLAARYVGTSFGKLIHWVSQNWYEVVGSGDERHLRAGTRVERVKSRNGVMFYAAKYLSKVDLEPWKDLDVGRFWGIYFRKNMPFGDPVEVVLSDQGAVELLRTMRKKIKLKGYAGRTLSIFADADFWHDKLPALLIPLGEWL